MISLFQRHVTKWAGTGVVLLCLCTGCIREVVMDAEDAPKVVVDCVLSEAPVQTLYLVYTKGASRPEAPALEEAAAVLTDLTENREAGRFSRAADGSWQLAYAAIPTHRYRLDVTVPGHEPVWAEQTMPPAPDIRVRWEGEWGKDSTNLYKDDYGYVFTVSSLKDPVWFYGMGYPSEESGEEPAALLATDFPGVDPFNQAELSYVTYTEQEFWYSDWLRFSTYPDLVGKPMHKRYLRFPARETLQETDFLVSGSLQSTISDKRDLVRAQKRHARLYYFSASEDYDRFLRESYHLLESKTSDNLTDIFLRTNVFSNIQGAIGLFGAKNELMMEWDGEDFLGRNGSFQLPGIAPPEHVPDDLEENFYITKEPFQLLHYELLVSDTPPSWAPPLPEGSDFEIAVLERASIIRNEAQLNQFGLGGIGPVDFSDKVVLLYVRQDPWLKIPILIKYARYQPKPEVIARTKPEEFPRYDRYLPSVQFVGSNIRNLNANVSFMRLAILVDGSPEFYDYNRTGWRTTWQHVKELTPQMVQAVEDLSGVEQRRWWRGY